MVVVWLVFGLVFLGLVPLGIVFLTMSHEEVPWMPGMTFNISHGHTQVYSSHAVSAVANLAYVLVTELYVTLNHGRCVIHKVIWTLKTVIERTMLGRDKSDHVWEEVLDGSVLIWVRGPTQISLPHSIEK